MDNIMNILNYGAVGDGVTDCTKAIQTALDDASTCMGTVIVPPGKYMVGKLKMHGQGVSISGTAAWSYRSDGASVFVLNDENSDSMIDITGAFGCAIRGMCLNGNHLGKNIHGIKLYWDEYNGGNGLFIDGWDGFVLDNWFSFNNGFGMKGGNVVASITATGNRVEWNQSGGFQFLFGDSYNFTGNFFDRSHGPAIELGGDKTVSLVTITGNIFRRSGAYIGKMPPKDRCCHVLLNKCTDMTVMGNTMRVGRNDGGGGVLSPEIGMIIKKCDSCIIKDNTMMNGAMKKLFIEENNESCIIRDNLGNLAVDDWSSGSELLN